MHIHSHLILLSDGVCKSEIQINQIFYYFISDALNGSIHKSTELTNYFVQSQYFVYDKLLLKVYR